MQTLEQYIEHIDRIIDTPQFNNAMAVGQMLIEILQDLDTNLSTIEAEFRRINSRIRLVGLPLRFYKNEYLKAILPKQEKSFDYGLWIGMNGPQEIMEMLDQNEVSLDDTDTSLLNTGFLTIKEL